MEWTDGLSTLFEEFLWLSVFFWRDTSVLVAVVVVVVVVGCTRKVNFLLVAFSYPDHLFVGAEPSVSSLRTVRYSWAVYRGHAPDVRVTMDAHDADSAARRDATVNREMSNVFCFHCSDAWHRANQSLTKHNPWNQTPTQTCHQHTDQTKRSLYQLNPTHETKLQPKSVTKWTQSKPKPHCTN